MAAVGLPLEQEAEQAEAQHDSHRAPQPAAGIRQSPLSSECAQCAQGQDDQGEMERVAGAVFQRNRRSNVEAAATVVQAAARVVYVDLKQAVEVQDGALDPLVQVGVRCPQVKRDVPDEIGQE